jgi:hypothetical protein
MGILKTHIKLIAMEQARSQIVKGRIITLGQQAVYSDRHGVEKILLDYGVAPKVLPETFDTKNKIPSWKGSFYDRFTNGPTVFALLGATVHIWQNTARIRIYRRRAGISAAIGAGTRFRVFRDT